MQLSDKTLAILKNFSNINQGLIIKEGNTLRTIAKSKSIVAFADVDETFPVDCQIYDLQKFLGIFSVFDSPDIEWNEKSATITSGKSGLRYGYGESVTPEPPTKMKPYVPQATFNLSAEDLSQIMKMASILESCDIVQFTLTSDKCEVSLESTEGANRNRFNIEVEADVEEDTIARLNLEDLRILSLPYKVEATNTSVRLVNEDYNLFYLIAGVAD
jgi:hypothetical protein